MRTDVAAILLIWLIMWLFNHITAVPGYVKDIANGVVGVLLILLLFKIL